MRDMNNTGDREPSAVSNESTRHRFADATRAVEYARMLRALTTAIPAPRVQGVEGTEVVCNSPTGRNGATVLNGDTAASVLSLCGRVLTKVHQVDTAAAFDRPAGSGVLVHGDFGPGRLRFHDNALTVSAIVGWEHAHIGSAVEDLAWCEWSVRNGHPDCFDAMPHLYYGYGIEIPPWPRRQSAMLAKCRRMGALAAARKDGTASAWHRRAAITAAWRA